MIPFFGIVWNVVLAGEDARLPVATPEGAFHHAGQRAIYAALTAEGAIAARWPLAHPDDPPREVVPLRVALARVADARRDGRPAQSWQ
ncbi:MAG: RES domain-containing protein, partial [Rhodobacteraceae bacterium]|nr:RES domain-containing protein [Paracoccaceae bacterium]